MNPAEAGFRVAAGRPLSGTPDLVLLIAVKIAVRAEGPLRVDLGGYRKPLKPCPAVLVGVVRIAAVVVEVTCFQVFHKTLIYTWARGPDWSEIRV